MQRNLRELLKDHRMSGTCAATLLGVSYQIFYRRMLNEGRVQTGEVEGLANRLGVRAEVVQACVEESKVRPGHDARGRRKRAGGQHAEINVGLGQAGHSPVPAQMPA